MAQGFGKAQYGKFGRVISALGRHANQAENRRNIGDMTTAFGHEMRQKGLRAIDHAPEINIHQPFAIIEAHLRHRRAKGHTGIVQNQISPAMIFFHLRCQVEHGIAVGNIDHIGFHAAFGGFHRGFGVGQHILAQISADNHTPLRCHCARASRANAAAGTGNHTDFIFELTHKTLPEVAYNCRFTVKKPAKSPAQTRC